MFCALLGQDIEGEGLKDHWSSGFTLSPVFPCSSDS